MPLGVADRTLEDRAWHLRHLPVADGAVGIEHLLRQFLLKWMLEIAVSSMSTPSPACPTR